MQNAIAELDGDEMTHVLWGMIKDDVLPIFLLALLSTVVTFGIAGRVTQNLRKKEEKKDAAS